MQIIELTDTQFKNYSNIHSQRNYLQTLCYDKFFTKGKYKSKYLGLKDDENNIVAATLLIYETLRNKTKVGYVPGGFLIDLTNYQLLNKFITKLTGYLKEKNYIYIRVSPTFTYKKFKTNLKLEEQFDNKIENLKCLGANFLIKQDKFSKYDVILEVKDISFEKALSMFKRKARREIKNSSYMAITIEEGTKKNIETFYNLIKNNDKKDINYYKDLLSAFNGHINKAEIYFAKLNTKNYLNNFIYLEKKEREINETLNNRLTKTNSKRTLHKKMSSDQRLTKYKNEIIKATNLYKKYPDGVILSTALIIRNNHEVYFITDGYNQELKKIYSLTTLKWEIIKKYLNKGYKKFNLGEIHESLNNKNSKYYSLYAHKTALGNKIIEYSNDYDIIINKYLYAIYAGVNTIKNSLKIKD